MPYTRIFNCRCNCCICQPGICPEVFRCAGEEMGCLFCCLGVGYNTCRMLLYHIASFSSIHKRGAGLGPAIAFLYSGPAINILAIILTARILGWELGLARVLGAVVFAIVIGLMMAWIFRKEEKEKEEAQMKVAIPPEKRPLWQTALHFFALVLILVFANWGRPAEGVDSGGWYFIWSNKWYITGFFGLVLAYSLVRVLKISFWKVAASVLTVVLASLLFTDPMIPFVSGYCSVGCDNPHKRR
jgi:uncharacterized protein